MALDFRQFGGEAIIAPREGIYAAASSLDDESLKDALADPDAIIAWNFGIDLSHAERQGMTPGEWENKQSSAALSAFAKLPLKEWDGKTSTKRMAMTKRIKHHGAPGAFLPAQFQPRGTCVGRGASSAINVFQALLCLSGWPLEWKPVSHAWCYAGSRMQYNDLGSSDGASGKGAFEWCRGKGVCYQEEAGDTDYYKDDVAAAWARRGIPAEIIAKGKDNPLTDAFPVTTAKQAADVLFSGGCVTIASNRGFSMQRDADGVCAPRGTWNHQMHLADIRVTTAGRKIFDIAQSWGENGGGLSGPQCPDQPNYVFGADWDVVNGMLRQGDSMGAMNFEGWLQELSWGTA